MKKVSFVCTTFRRATCVKRILSQYYAQTYPNKELIIFNTDEQFPLSLDEPDSSIIVVNNGIDLIKGTPYTNRGDICRDAVSFATGDLFMLADDDDVYLPWHIEQAVNELELCGKDAWKPEKSLFATPDKIELASNTMEASVIVKMNRIKEIGFRNDLTGYEGLSWYTKLRDEGQLDENSKNYLPSYCFNWSDPNEIAGHKQSGDINNPNNFENHKLASIDVFKESLKPLTESELFNFYKPYYDFIYKNSNLFSKEHYSKYFS